jgi:hypothetical protein
MASATTVTTQVIAPRQSSLSQRQRLGVSSQVAGLMLQLA